VPVVIDNAAGLGEKGSTALDENSFEVFSLHATKPFAIGEGGAIRSRLRWAKALRLALNFGARTWGSTKRLGDQR